MVFEKDVQNILDKCSLNELKGKSVLITGSTGLVGSILVNVLIKNGTKLILPVRNFEKAIAKFGNEPSYVDYDMFNSFSFDSKVDYVIHLASATSSKYFIENPVETIRESFISTLNLLDFSKLKDVKAFVYISSMEMYGKTEENQNPVDEDKLGFIDVLNTRSSYSEGKRICELLCYSYMKEYGVPIRICRLANTFGAGVPLNDTRLFMQLAKSVINKTDITLHTKGLSMSNFVYTSDAVTGILTVLLKGSNGEAYNVCNDKETRSVSEIAELVSKKVANGQIKVIYDIPDTNKFGYPSDTKLRLTSKKLESLGWKAEVGMEEAYKRLIEFIGDNKER